MHKDKIIKEFESILEELELTDPVQLFQKLKRYNLSRVELMIIDSSIKGMALHSLHNTLLLTETAYLEALQNLTLNILKLWHKETHS